jgi:hypothetical protein
MEVTVKVKALLESVGSLTTLMTCKKIKPKVTFRLGKLMRKCQQELDDYNTAVQKLRETYGEKIELKNDKAEVTGHTWKIKPEHQEMFKLEHEQLLAEECEIIVPKVTVEEVVAPAELSPADCSALDWLIVEDDETVPIAKAEDKKEEVRA